MSIAHELPLCNKANLRAPEVKRVSYGDSNCCSWMSIALSLSQKKKEKKKIFLHLSRCLSVPLIRGKAIPVKFWILILASRAPIMTKKICCCFYPLGSKPYKSCSKHSYLCLLDSTILGTFTNNDDFCLIILMFWRITRCPRFFKFANLSKTVNHFVKDESIFIKIKLGSNGLIEAGLYI